jgi:hypothetical protein
MIAFGFSESDVPHLRGKADFRGGGAHPNVRSGSRQDRCRARVKRIRVRQSPPVCLRGRQNRTVSRSRQIPRSERPRWAGRRGSERESRRDCCERALPCLRSDSAEGSKHGSACAPDEPACLMRGQAGSFHASQAVLLISSHPDCARGSPALAARRACSRSLNAKKC